MMQPTRQHWDDDSVTPPATTEVARLELAALCRLLARERLTPIGGARIAARDPENQSFYLIHPAAPLFEASYLGRRGRCHRIVVPVLACRLHHSQ